MPDAAYKPCGDKVSPEAISVTVLITPGDEATPLIRSGETNTEHDYMMLAYKNVKKMLMIPYDQINVNDTNQIFR